MTQLLPNGKQHFMNNNGQPLSGGRVFHYYVGTNNPKDTFQDANETIPNTNPIVLNARGEAAVYGTGPYRQVLQNASGSVIWDQVILDPGGDAGVQLQEFISSLAGSGAAEGGGLVGWSRSALTSAIGTVSAMLDAQAVNLWEFASLAIGYAPGSSAVAWDWTPAIQAALNYFGSPLVAPPMTGGGLVVIPPMPGGGSYRMTGITVPVRVSIRGHGWASILENVGSGDAISYIGTASVRNVDQRISDVRIKGNAGSRHGLYFEFTAARGTGGTAAGTAQGVGVTSVIYVENCKIDGHGVNGVQYGKDASTGSGNKFLLLGCYIGDNGSHGVLITAQSNLLTVSDCSIVYNAFDGVQLNQVASTCSITQNFISDNGRFGVHAFRCEQPIITHNGFNRNVMGGVVLNGDPVGSSSVKYTEAAFIFGNLFGDNGKSSPTPRELQVRASKGTNIIGNYFYATGTPTMIYLGDNAEGVAISGNHFKDLVTEVKLQVKVGAIDTWYTFDDDVSAQLRVIESSQVVENIIGPNTTLFRTRVTAADSSPRFLLRGDGFMSWASGSAPSDISLSRVNAGALRIDGSVEMIRCEVSEGAPAPNAKTGYARIYVDGSGGSAAIRVRFSDGTIKTFNLS